MTNIERKKLPAGVQSFTKIREGGFLYVDKSDIVYRLANNGFQYNYLSRPRRFGKSVLVDTLQAYFEGRKELFEGLKIMQLEKDWLHYPVIRLDMSGAGANEESLRSYLDSVFAGYEERYGVEQKSTASLAVRFDSIIKAVPNSSSTSRATSPSSSPKAWPTTSDSPTRKCARH